MNILSPTIRRATLAAGKRFKSSISASNQGVHELPPQTAVPPQLQKAAANKPKESLKDMLLKDPATYPITLVTGIMLTFMTATGLHSLFHCQDVRIAPEKKHAIIRSWGNNGDEVGTKVALGLGISQNTDYQDIVKHEGQGIDHQQWVKEKKQAKENADRDEFDQEFIDSVKAKHAKIQRKLDEEAGLI